MIKKIACIAVSCILCGSAFAQGTYDPKTGEIIKDIRNGIDNLNQIQVLRVKGSATVGGDETLTGKMIATPVSVTAADGMVLTNSATVMSVTMLGATCRVANVTAPGQVCYITVTKPASTGVLAVASSGNFIGPALSLAPGEMATLVAVGTNWFAVGQ